jgi:ABC-type uncharacterized transport system substrate-binding protein
MPLMDFDVWDHTHYIDYRYVRAAEPCRPVKADQRKPEKETPL